MTHYEYIMTPITHFRHDTYFVPKKSIKKVFNLNKMYYYFRVFLMKNFFVLSQSKDVYVYIQVVNLNPFDISLFIY